MIRNGKFHSLLVSSLCFLALLPGCREKEPVEDAGQIAQIAPAPFLPPVDGRLAKEQVTRFLLAREALSKVNEHYLESMKNTAPELRREIAPALEIAKEKVCREFGLNGYEEYRWILEEAPLKEENRQLMADMDVKISL